MLLCNREKTMEMQDLFNYLFVFIDQYLKDPIELDNMSTTIQLLYENF